MPQYYNVGSLKGFISQREEPSGDTDEFNEKFKIVAISDPNDLLSYRIPDWLKKELPQIPFVNVTTSVVRSALIIPFVGTVADPAAAHQNYGQDKCLLDLIVNGHKKK